MRFADPTQNLSARIRAIYVLILLMFVALVENVGFGSRFAAPAARAVFEAYYRKTSGVIAEPPLEARLSLERRVEQ